MAHVQSFSSLGPHAKESALSSRMAGAALVAAAALFWLSWLLMPGVGITDAARIFELVGEHAARVRVSVAAQLFSAACYAPALVGIVATRRLRRQVAVRAGAILLAIGAMGSAADGAARALALAVLGLVAASQAWLGLALWRPPGNGGG